MQKFQDVVLDSQGRPVPGAVIAVQSFPGGSPATVYQTNSVGAAYVPTTDSLGGFFFYAPDGNYSYTVTVANVLRATVTDIQLQDLNPDPVFTGVITADGIKFPAIQDPSADANTLDDYEEGVWTPSVTSGSGTITTLGAVAGRYTKVGQWVKCYFTVAITTNGTAGGVLVIAGLPFARTGAASIAGYGREDLVSGKQLLATEASTTSINVANYDNTWPGANGSLCRGYVEYFAS
jgi:hypothetical protein